MVSIFEKLHQFEEAAVTAIVSPRSSLIEFLELMDRVEGLSERVDVEAITSHQQDAMDFFKWSLETDDSIQTAAEKWPEFSLEQQMDVFCHVANEFYRPFSVRYPVDIRYDSSISEVANTEDISSDHERYTISLNPLYHDGPERATFAQNLNTLTHELVHLLQLSCYGCSPHQEERDLHDLMSLLPMVKWVSSHRDKFCITQEYADSLCTYIYTWLPSEVQARQIAAYCTKDLSPICHQPCNKLANPQVTSSRLMSDQVLVPV